MHYPSSLIEQAVEEIAKLPGIGRKTALRLALHLLRQEEQQVQSLADAMVKLRTQTRYCKKCHNLSDSEVCSICQSARRDRSTICVVENPQDVMAIENTAQYQGLYHVLGGLISPMEGVGPGDLQIASLIDRLAADPEQPVNELILALSPTMEGDTTAFYLTKKVKERPIRVTTLARGVPIGGELEYTDEITLGRSILSRIRYDNDGNKE